MDSLLREEQVELAVTCAVFIAGLQQGLNPLQKSDFFIPWGKAPESEEEQFHQDLVWVYKALPPNDKFNRILAAKGTYKKLRLKVLAEFWSNYDPEQDKEIKFKKTYTPRSYPRTHNDSTKPSTLKAIRKHLADGNHDF